MKDKVNRLENKNFEYLWEEIKSRFEILICGYFNPFIKNNQEISNNLTNFEKKLDKLIKELETFYPDGLFLFERELNCANFIETYYNDENIPQKLAHQITLLNEIKKDHEVIHYQILDLYRHLKVHEYWVSVLEKLRSKTPKDLFISMFKAVIFEWGSTNLITLKIKKHFDEKIQLLVTNNEKDYIIDRVISTIRSLYQSMELVDIYQNFITNKIWNASVKIMDFLRRKYYLKLKKNIFFILGSKIFVEPVNTNTFISIKDIRQRIELIESQIRSQFDGDFHAYLSYIKEEQQLFPTRYGISEKDFQTHQLALKTVPCHFTWLRFKNFESLINFEKIEDLVYLWDKIRVFVINMFRFIPESIKSAELKDILEDLLFIIKNDIYQSYYFISSRSEFTLNESRANLVINNYLRIQNKGVFFDMFGNIPLISLGVLLLGNKVVVNDYIYGTGKDYQTLQTEIIQQKIAAKVLKNQTYGCEILDEIQKETNKKFNLDDGFTPVSKNKVFPTNFFTYLMYDENIIKLLKKNIVFTSLNYFDFINKNEKIKLKDKSFNYIFIDPPFGVKSIDPNIKPSDLLKLSKYCLSESYRLLTTPGSVCITLPPLKPEKFHHLIGLNWLEEIKNLIKTLGFKIAGALPKTLENREKRTYLTLLL